MLPAPALRVRAVTNKPINPAGEFVVYWMVAYRRPHWNFSLQHAAHWAHALRKPLVILEPLRCDYAWASDRLHHFVVQGMADNQRLLASKPVRYYPYVETRSGAGKGLLAALARRAALIISDEYPAFFLPRMHRAAAAQFEVRFELVDSNGLLPMRAAPQAFSRAFDFRRFLQKSLRPYLDEFPEPDPLAGCNLPRYEALPTEILERWPPLDGVHAADDPAWLSALPIDHGVSIAPRAGGAVAARQRLNTFLNDHFARYGDDRGLPSRDGTSGLSPYLHFGHLSVHEVFTRLTQHDQWTPDKVSSKSNGSAQGWWGASRHAEAFLDELITWRELGFNMCYHREDYDRYSSLPDWARTTLDKHAADPRPHVYHLEQFAKATTHDPLWNAAQQQLVREGRIHNYLRMLWGKKILEWSAHPHAALEIMIELNNKYALDGRDPNSYSGIFWVLGRYDRPWGPERPIFGKVRYMSSENTARKLQVADYVRQYSAP